MATQNLIPTMIEDRNGRQTIVYRSGVPTGKETARSIPAPAPATTSEAKNLRAALAYELGEIDINNVETQKGQRVVEALQTMDMPLLRALTKTMPLMHELDKAYPGGFAVYSLFTAVEHNDRQALDVFIEHGHRAIGSKESLKDIVDVIMKLKSMDTTRTSYTANIDAHLEAASKLTYLTGSGNRDYFYQTHESLIKFINKYPDKVDEILAYRLERKLKKISAADIKEWNDAGALQEGIL